MMMFFLSARSSCAFALSVAVLACTVVGDDDCKPKIQFSGKGVYEFDLTGLRHTKGQMDYQCMDELANTFYFNVCGELTLVNQTECEGAAVCQKSPLGVFYNAGMFGSQKISPDYESGPGRGIVLYYENGTSCSKDENRRTVIFIECDEDATIPVIQPAETDNCSFAFHMTSKYGCGKKLGGSSSGCTTVHDKMPIQATALVLAFFAILSSFM